MSSTLVDCANDTPANSTNLRSIYLTVSTHSLKADIVMYMPRPALADPARTGRSGMARTPLKLSRPFKDGVFPCGIYANSTSALHDHAISASWPSTCTVAEKQQGKTTNTVFADPSLLSHLPRQWDDSYNKACLGRFYTAACCLWTALPC